MDDSLNMLQVTEDYQNNLEIMLTDDVGDGSAAPKKASFKHNL